MPTDNDDALPSREDIAERLEAQRKAIWHAQGICSLASSAGEHFRDDGKGSAGAFATDVWTALEGVSKMLDRVAGALEPDVLLTAAKVTEART
jgi:hypothetical protein